MLHFSDIVDEVIDALFSNIFKIYTLPNDLPQGLSNDLPQGLPNDSPQKLQNDSPQKLPNEEKITTNNILQQVTTENDTISESLKNNFDSIMQSLTRLNHALDKINNSNNQFDNVITQTNESQKENYILKNKVFKQTDKNTLQEITYDELKIMLIKNCSNKNLIYINVKKFFKNKEYVCFESEVEYVVRKIGRTINNLKFYGTNDNLVDFINLLKKNIRNCAFYFREVIAKEIPKKNCNPLKITSNDIIEDIINSLFDGIHVVNECDDKKNNNTNAEQMVLDAIILIACYLSIGLLIFTICLHVSDIIKL